MFRHQSESGLLRLQCYNDVNRLCWMATCSGIKVNAMIKVNVWKSNGMQEKESTMDVRWE